MTRSQHTVQVSPAMATVLARMAEDAERLFGTTAVRIAPVVCQVRESSEVARIRITGAFGTSHVFAKVFRPRPREVETELTTARFRRDCEATRLTFEAMKTSPELRSVEPIAYYEDLLALVTREVRGVPLHVAIGKGAAWFVTAGELQQLEVALSRVGRWISFFQRVARNAEPAPIRLEATREYIDARLKVLTTLPVAAFEEADRRAVLTHLDRRVAEVSAGDLVEVPVHGDIAPSNVVVAPESITVLDFGMAARGSRYMDIARLYTQLEFYRGKPQFRPAAIRKLQAAALAGFEPTLRPDHPLFEICAVQHVVCHLLSHARQPGRFPASLYSRRLCRLHRGWLRERIRRHVAARPGSAPSDAWSQQ